MTLGQAIAEKDIGGIIAVVEASLEIYKVAKPAVPKVETAFGGIPFTAVYDEETKWLLIGQAYAEVVAEASEIDPKLDLKVEQAKIIGGNAILRNVTEKVTGIEGGLL